MQSEPFLPHDVEGWLRIGAMISAALLGAWGIVTRAVKRSAETERQLTKDALELEAVERKAADSRMEERLEDIAQKVFVWMGKFDLLVERLHDERLAAAKELAAFRLENERGFNTMRDMLMNCPYREDHPVRGARDD